MALLASLCLAQPRELKQSLSDIENIVNSFVPPDKRAALYSSAASVISSVPGAASALSGVVGGGGGRGPTLAPANPGSTNAASQGALRDGV
ncbi:hypothetical protein WJX81_005634 [Elliptochloris bilobata]|uniref:Uncharacterized protein n=1 Tax=Elliptochloris bilobata TaxID=381761 RepID=A0AAW1SKV0_9CHLO